MPAARQVRPEAAIQIALHRDRIGCGEWPPHHPAVRTRHRASPRRRAIAAAVGRGARGEARIPSRRASTGACTQSPGRGCQPSSRKAPDDPGERQRLQPLHQRLIAGPHGFGGQRRGRVDACDHPGQRGIGGKSGCRQGCRVPSHGVKQVVHRHAPPAQQQISRGARLSTNPLSSPKRTARLVQESQIGGGELAALARLRTQQRVAVEDGGSGASEFQALVAARARTERPSAGSRAAPTTCVQASSTAGCTARLPASSACSGAGARRANAWPSPRQIASIARKRGPRSTPTAASRSNARLRWRQLHPRLQVGQGDRLAGRTRGCRQCDQPATGVANPRTGIPGP